MTVVPIEALVFGLLSLDIDRTRCGHLSHLWWDRVRRLVAVADFVENWFLVAFRNGRWFGERARLAEGEGRRANK